MKKNVAAVCVLLCAALLLAGCTPNAPPATPSPGTGEVTKQTRTAFYFDTVVIMTVYTDDSSILDDAARECARYENLLSKTVEGSDVWNLNHAEGRRVAVSSETRDIIEKALEYARRSDGKFDITIEPCAALWDFTGGEGTQVLPEEAALAAAAAKVDYTQVDVNDQGVLLPAGTTIDLGAIAKGYITDRIADLLTARGVTSGILNFGGNVLAIGNKPDGTQWKIGIQDPRAERDTSLGVLPVTGGAVVTSGIYERGFDLDGIRYHHILDPATGWPVQNDLAGVTIVADDAFDGDALSTTVFAMGRDAGAEFVESLEGVEAVFVTRDGQVSWTSGLEGRLTLLSG